MKKKKIISALAIAFTFGLALTGCDSQSASAPSIGANGNWYIGDTDTGVSAAGQNGSNGSNGTNGTNGTNGITPSIGENGNWYIGDVDTKIPAKGQNGTNGIDGTNGTNGTNGVDGTNGTNGITPTIGENGNWFIGDTDTGVPATPTVEKKTVLNKVGTYEAGMSNADGGVAEIVKYNKDNGKIYLVNGITQTIDIVQTALSDKSETNLKTVFNENTDRIQLNPYVTEHSSDFEDGFEIGDITSIAINEELNVIAVAVQHTDYTKNGAVILLNYDGTYKVAYKTGVQPDMVTFAGSKVLTADEGEPREGYAASTTDPQGSVTVIDLAKENPTSNIINFSELDSKRDELVSKGVLLMKDAKPSVDLEPEYITVSNQYAYVSLQEANSILTIDLNTETIKDIHGLGIKNHNLIGNEIDLIETDGINIKAQDAYGVYMPDTIDSYTVAGRTYLVTANEGDAREWGDFEGVKKETSKFKDASGVATKVEVLDNAKWDGLDADKSYVLGGRSFSIFDAETMELIYDSGSIIEKEVGSNELTKDFFNASNDNNKLDSRSKKKGPEVEAVKIGVIDGRRYAFVGLERVSGVMTFDITNIKDVKLLDYANTRDFSLAIAGDVAPESIDFISATDSVNSKNLVVVSNEVSGTIAIYQVDSSKKEYTIDAENTKKTIEQMDHLVINCVYGDGGKGDGPVSNSFISILNPTDQSINLSTYSIEYKSGDVTKTIPLSGTLQAHKSYIILGAEVAGSTNKITFSEDEYSIKADDLVISNKTYQITLLNNDAICDRVGVKEASTDIAESESAALVGQVSKQKMILRNNQDTDNNVVDFSVVELKDLTPEAALQYKPAL